MPELALASYHGGELDGILKGLVNICKYHQLSWGSQMNIGIYHLQQRLLKVDNGVG